MKKILTRKLTTTFLAMVMAVIILPFSASAAVSGDGWTFDSTTGTLIVSSNSGTIAWRGSITDKTTVLSVELTTDVTSIGHMAFAYCENLANITIPSSVTSIGGYAFYGCANLTIVTIPSSVTSIGYYAFYGCKALLDITLPSSVTSIGESAFDGCTNLANVTFASDSQLENISARMFYGCKALLDITLPSSVTSIGAFAFTACSALENITIPRLVTKIESEAFSNCKSLKTVTFEDDSKLESIGNGAFVICEALTNIAIPSSVTSIDESAFYKCINLETVTLKKDSKLGILGKSAFEECGKLTSISLPSSLTIIGDRAFYNCTALTSTAIPSLVTSIGVYAFKNCISLATVTLEKDSKLETIKTNAFEGCTALTSIVIPSPVTSIGEYAFLNCTSLSRIDFLGSTSLANNMFISVPALKVYVPVEAESAYSSSKFPSGSKFYYVCLLTVVNGNGGREFLKSEAGTEVTISADTAPAGKVFDKWTTESSGVTFADANSETTTFPIPAGNVTVTATYKDAPVLDYAVTVNGGTGSGNFAKDETVTITAGAAPSGKVFDKWTTTNTDVTFTNANAPITTFTMPASNVTVTATFKDKPAEPVIPDPPSTGGSYTPPSPSVAGGTGWNAVKNAIINAAEGSNVAINMNGGTELPKSTLDAVKGKDINLVITMSNGYVWTINGKDITETKNIDLTVKKPLTQRIPTEVLNTVTGEKYQLYLGFEGDFGFKAVLTVPLGSTNSGRYANLFYFNPTTKKLEYVSSGKIGTDGKTGLNFSHASDYVITITSEISTDVKSDSSETDTSSESNPTTGDKMIPLGAILIIAAGAILITNKKAKRS